LLPIENPGYIFVKESATSTWKKTTSLFHQEEGISVVQAINNNPFEEALGL
jgi:hypothetical protein